MLFSYQCQLRHKFQYTCQRPFLVSFLSSLLFDKLKILYKPFRRCFSFKRMHSYSQPHMTKTLKMWETQKNATQDAGVENAESPHVAEALLSFSLRAKRHMPLLQFCATFSISRIFHPCTFIVLHFPYPHFCSPQMPSVL